MGNGVHERLVLRRGCPPVVIGESHRGLIRDTSALCETVCPIWCCLSVIITSIMASKQQQGFRKCGQGQTHNLTGGDTHILCVACLGEEHARSALDSAGCEHCDMLPLRTLRSRLAFFCEDAQARVPQGSGPAAAEAQRRLRPGVRKGICQWR